MSKHKLSDVAAEFEAAKAGVIPKWKQAYDNPFFDPLIGPFVDAVASLPFPDIHVPSDVEEAKLLLALVEAEKDPSQWKVHSYTIEEAHEPIADPYAEMREFHRRSLAPFVLPEALTRSRDDLFAKLEALGVTVGPLLHVHDSITLVVPEDKLNAVGRLILNDAMPDLFAKIRSDFQTLNSKAVEAAERQEELSAAAAQFDLVRREAEPATSTIVELDASDVRHPRDYQEPLYPKTELQLGMTCSKCGCLFVRDESPVVFASGDILHAYCT